MGSPREHVEWLERRLLWNATLETLALVDSESGAAVLDLAQGQYVIDLAQTGTRLSLSATASGSAAVGFNIDGEPRVDDVAPFAVAELPVLRPGIHSLVVTPYAEPAGKPGESRMVLLHVRDSRPVPGAIRINAGGRGMIDSAARVFAADSGFFGSRPLRSPGGVLGTDDDALYSDMQRGRVFAYQREVPDGHYLARLHFMNPRGQRSVFDVYAESQLIIDDLNLASAAGLNQALVREAEIAVHDGVASFWFSASAGDAMVSAIELLPLRVPARPEPLRINAGGGVVIDSTARAFFDDMAFKGGMTGSSAGDILKTPDDALFGTYREGALSLSYPVASGNYLMLLGFADPASTMTGQRVFSISAEGRTIENTFDIFARAGRSTATVLAKRIAINDGVFDLSLGKVAGQPLISYVQLIPTDPPADAPAPVPHAVKTASQLRSIGADIFHFYSNDHRGMTPPSFADLVDHTGICQDNFINERTGKYLPRGELTNMEWTAFVSVTNDFVYTGANVKIVTQPPTRVLAYENPTHVHGDELNVLFFDGHVETVTRLRLQELLLAEMPLGPEEPVIAPPGLMEPAIISSQLQIRELSQALWNWSLDHYAGLPNDLGTLARDVNVRPEAFINPRGTTEPPPVNMTPEQLFTWVNDSTDYRYVGRGRFVYGYPDAVILYENPAMMRHGINILFLDQHVEFREMRWAMETLLRVR